MHERVTTCDTVQGTKDETEKEDESKKAAPTGSPSSQPPPPSQGKVEQ